MNSQPKKKFMQKIAPLFSLPLAKATIVGTKYTIIPKYKSFHLFSSCLYNYVDTAQNTSYMLYFDYYNIDFVVCQYKMCDVIIILGNINISQEMIL